MDKVLVILKKFWKLKWWVAGIPLLSVSLVVFLTRNQERKYISTATLQIDLPTTGAVSITGSEYKQYESNVFFYNFTEMVKSRKVAEMVRMRILAASLRGKNDLVNFSENPDLLPDTAQILQRACQLGEGKHMPDLNNPVDNKIDILLGNNRLSLKELQGNLKVGRSGNSNYINISFESASPHKSALITGFFAEVATSQQGRMARARVEKNRVFMAEQVTMARVKLDEKIRELEQFKVKNNIINLGEHTEAIVDQLVQLESKVAHLKELESAHKAAAERTRQILSSGAPTEIDQDGNARIVALKDSLRRLHEEQALLAPESGKAATLARQANLLKQQVIQEIGKMVQNVPYDPGQTRQDLVGRYIGYKLDHEMEGIMIVAVEKELERLTRYAARFAPLESTIGTLTSEIRTAQESYLTLLNKLNLLQTLENSSSDVEVSIFAPPALPREPESSKRMLMVLAAGAGAFIIVSSSIAGFVMLDRRVYSVADFEQASGITPRYVFNCPGSTLPMIKSLRKKVALLPRAQRVLLLVGMENSDNLNEMAGHLLNALNAWPGRQLLIDATEKGLDTSLPTWQEGDDKPEGTAVLRCEPGMSPFEYRDPEEWQQWLKSCLEHFEGVVIAGQPVCSNAHWEEWAHISHAAVLYCEGGKMLGRQILKQTEMLLGLPFAMKEITFREIEQ